MTTTPEFAGKFTRDWIEAWNTHDLPSVLAHYTDDFEMSSPFIAQFTKTTSGRLKGKANVAAYWGSALDRLPNLRFELRQVLVGASSVVLVYETNFGRTAAETFSFNEEGLVERAAAHYCEN